MVTPMSPRTEVQNINAAADHFVASSFKKNFNPTQARKEHSKMNNDHIARIAKALEHIAKELSEIKAMQLCEHRFGCECEPGTRRYTKQVDEVLKVMPTIRKDSR
jgi:hypothetical protein